MGALLTQIFWGGTEEHAGLACVQLQELMGLLLPLLLLTIRLNIIDRL